MPVNELLNLNATFAQLLFVGKGLNFQSTADQILTPKYLGSAYFISVVVARQRSGAASVACAGGLYDGAGKTGNIMVAAVQSWVTLAAGVMVTASLAALTQTTLLTATPILSLTTGSTAACTGDIFVFGYDVS